ncbi:MAG: hypothetical protein ACLUKN_07475 [Bacilli bacterium]
MGSTRLSGVETILIMCGTTSPTTLSFRNCNACGVATDDAVTAIHIQVVFIPYDMPARVPAA